jgi:hypothetical protein
MSVGEIQVQINAKALAHLRLQIDGLVLRGGRLVVPIAETNQPARQLSVERIQTDLRLLPDDEWVLDNFKAMFAGAMVQLSGTVMNASSIRDWAVIRGQGTLPPGSWQARLRRLADTLQLFYFSSPPDLEVDVRGDAKNLESFKIRMMLNAPGTETPWGSVSCGQFTARLSPATRTDVSRADLSLSAEEAQTAWGTITNLKATVRLVPVEGGTNLIQGELKLSAQQVATEWASSTNARFEAHWIHDLTQPVPVSGQGEVHLSGWTNAWAAADEVQVVASLVEPDASKPPAPADAKWGWWAALQPYALNWEARVRGARFAELRPDELKFGGNWRAPQLTVSNLHAGLQNRQIDIDGNINVATRALSTHVVCDIDPHKISPILPPSARALLNELSWTEPPHLKADAGLVLPPWTNRQPNWDGVRPSLCLRGGLEIPSGAAYRGVSFTYAQSHFTCTNLVWQLPDVVIRRPEGRLQASGRVDERNETFYSHISSSLDPKAVEPLLDAGQRRTLDLATFTEPPDLDVEIRGRFHEPDRISAKGRISVTNFTFRGESATGLETGFQYTNRVLEFFEPRVQRAGKQLMTADGIKVDIDADVLHMTNGFSTADPMFIATAIGPQIVTAIRPYRFTVPPVGHVYGIIPLHGEKAADVHFDLEGGPFEWWRFKVPHIAGHIHWRGEHLELSNITMDFYGGRASGAATFDFQPSGSANYQFNITTANTLLQDMMTDVFARTNRLEGRLDATLIVTKANTASDHAVDGYGNAKLSDGLIWDIPLFGVFSPVLDGIAPGLGSSRANAAACTFVLNNGVIRSDDLEIRSPAMRLEYRGTVDLDGRVNARVEAELLRDMWLFGPLVSTVFWPVSKMFEYKVAGTLDEPKTEPVFIIPKIMMMPFHPFRSSKGTTPEQTAPLSTNAPPTTP